MFHFKQNLNSRLARFSLPAIVGAFILILVWGSSRHAAGTATFGGVTRAGATRAAPRVVESYGKLPLSFEVNQGQTDAQVRFLARGQGYALFLTSEEAVLSLRKPAADSLKGGKFEDRDAQLIPARLPFFDDRSSRVAGPSGQLAGPQGGRRITNAALHMRVVGANAKARVEGAEELPGKSNYFIGNDPKKWRTNIPTYAKARFEDIYPGVDLVYYGNQGQLEYDFVVRPGADPNVIKLALSSSDSVPTEIGRDGDLLVRVDGGEVRFHKPVVYQSAGGENGRPTGEKTLVAGRYTINEQKEVAFLIGDYDKTKPLVIDPVLVYSTYLGGGGGDFGQAIAIDSSGNAYVSGYTESANFPTTANAFQRTSTQVSAFVTKFNASGSALIYSTFLGGTNGPSYGYGIALDGSGNAYITGSTGSSDFPTANAFQATNRSFQPLSNSNANAYVTKLDATGSALIYSTFLGGSQRDQGMAIAVDSSGNAYVTGSTSSSNFPTAHPLQSVNKGSGAVFVTKFTPAGSALVYSTYLGGSGYNGTGDVGKGIAADNLGNAYVTGITGSTSFPTANPLQAHLAGFDSNAFVTKLNASGSAFVYSTYLGGSRQNWGNAISVDRLGNAYVTGNTSSTDFPTDNAFQHAYRSTTNNTNAFVAKLNSAGSALVYSTYLGGSGNSQSFWGDSGNGIAVDKTGNAYVTGYTSSADFPTAHPVQATNHGGPKQFLNAFVSEFDPAGSALLYSTYFGGSDNPQDFTGDTGNAITVDKTGNAYITGSTDSTDFPTTSNAFQRTKAGAFFNSFVAKISPPEAELAVSNTAPGSVRSESALTYTIVVTNHGPDPASALSIQDTIPAGATFHSVFVTTGSCKAPAPGGTGTVTCAASILASGHSITETLVVNVIAASGSTIKDTARASSSTFDPSVADNSAVATTIVTHQ